MTPAGCGARTLMPPHQLPIWGFPGLHLGAEPLIAQASAVGRTAWHRVSLPHFTVVRPRAGCLPCLSYMSVNADDNCTYFQDICEDYLSLKGGGARQSIHT